ncbi:uncharacterized protein LOC121802591, partial [Salvia splendens]|uniref:uncharacterized protein LOC121802591 n=1 Tax=Salvia splendens TaxID=180675 RepID=UPI001C2646C2
PLVSISALKSRIGALTSIPFGLQLLLNNSRILNDHQTLIIGRSDRSLLKGAATKAGQKKTNNFDACRDMSGRRLRHVNVEKKLEEWRAEERKLAIRAFTMVALDLKSISESI